MKKSQVLEVRRACARVQSLRSPFMIHTQLPMLTCLCTGMRMADGAKDIITTEL